jgi:hypothetical protein
MMNQQNSLFSNGRLRRALSGLLFVACFIAGDVLGSALAATPLPQPGAPAAQIARYYDNIGAAELVRGVSQTLSAASLFVFAGCVVAAHRVLLCSVCWCWSF